MSRKIAILLVFLALLTAVGVYWYFKCETAMAYGKSQTFLGSAIMLYESNAGHHLPHDIGGLSWRVELLRCDADKDDLALFQQFHLDEPWDSAHNKSLIKKIPWWLQDPEGEKGYTCYRGVTGKNCAFEKGATVKPAAPGEPSLIAVVMTKESCPWTKPVDVPVEEVEKGDCLRWFKDSMFNKAGNSEDGFTPAIGSGGGSLGWRRTNPPVRAGFQFSK